MLELDLLTKSLKTVDWKLQLSFRLNVAIFLELRPNFASFCDFTKQFQLESHEKWRRSRINQKFN